MSSGAYDECRARVCRSGAVHTREEAELNHMSTKSPESPVKVVLYSSNSALREDVRLAVGRKAGANLPVIEWTEVATAWALQKQLDQGGVDLAIVDGESQPIGGLGLARQFKNEVFNCPPFLVITGRPQDAWLAAWSQADGAVPAPVDPVEVSTAVEELVTAWISSSRRPREDAM